MLATDDSPQTMRLNEGIAATARTLFVDQTAALGGAELSLFDLVKHRHFQDPVCLFQHGPFEELLKQSGADVRIIELPESAASVRKDSGAMASLAGLGSLVKLVSSVIDAARDCDVIYANTAKAFVVSALASIRLRKPLIYHVRDIISPQHFGATNRRALIGLARASRATIIANSSATAEAFIQAGGQRNSLHVVHNGIDPSDFDAAIADSDHHRWQLRGEMNIGPHDHTVAVFGRLSEWKGQHVALRAIAQLPETHLLIVGSALFGETDYADSLRQEAHELSIESRVHFLGFRRDIAAIMQACDLVVHCSIAPEPFGRVIVEGMLSGKPVIASDAGGATEILCQGVSGLLVKPDDPQALATAIKQLAADDAMNRRMAERGRQEALNRFSLARCAVEVMQVIDQVAAR